MCWEDKKYRADEQSQDIKTNRRTYGLVHCKISFMEVTTFCNNVAINPKSALCGVSWEEYHVAEFWGLVVSLKPSFLPRISFSFIFDEILLVEYSCDAYVLWITSGFGLAFHKNLFWGTSEIISLRSLLW